MIVRFNKHPRVNRLQHGIFKRHGSDSRIERKLRRFIPLPDKLKLPQSGVCFSLQAPIAVRACQGLRSTHPGCVADRTPFCIAHPQCKQSPVRNGKRDVRLSPDAAGCCAEHCCTGIFPAASMARARPLLVDVSACRSVPADVVIATGVPSITGRPSRSRTHISTAVAAWGSGGMTENRLVISMLYGGSATVISAQCCTELPSVLRNATQAL